jgi:hypothetical protein
MIRIQVKNHINQELNFRSLPRKRKVRYRMVVRLLNVFSCLFFEVLVPVKYYDSLTNVFLY